MIIPVAELPEEAYHASSGMDSNQWITRSMIACYIQDPSLFKLRYIDKDPMVQFAGSKSTRFGCYIEDYILNGDVSDYVRQPSECVNGKGETVKWTFGAGRYVDDPDGMTTKEWRELHTKLIKDDDHDLAVFLEKRFADTAMGIYWLKRIKESEKQVTVRWKDEETGLNLQVRIDNLLRGLYMVDLKSTGKSLDKFSQAAEDYGYGLQEAMYSEGYCHETGEKLPYVFAVAETTGMHRARIITLHPAQVSYYKEQYRVALRGIAAGNFDAYDKLETKTMQAPLPSYLHYKYEDES
ncbi:PD-(D/E)XK nuclease-like domain-containing protein [Candidatus Babeliales bacterium]|nr:PD-(D/E)XK nuclease-like domain-containing protein [Candidatus Babeliales bacterium]